MPIARAERISGVSPGEMVVIWRQPAHGIRSTAIFFAEELPRFLLHRPRPILPARFRARSTRGSALELVNADLYGGGRRAPRPRHASSCAPTNALANAHQSLSIGAGRMMNASARMMDSFQHGLLTPSCSASTGATEGEPWSLDRRSRGAKSRRRRWRWRCRTENER
jgi:hypothetical protein